MPSGRAALPCRFFSRGLCKFGLQCRFSHDNDSSTPVAALPFHHREVLESSASSISSSSLQLPNEKNDCPNQSHTVRIMTYNILADQYAQEHARELYSSVPWRALEWGSRASLIAKEVGHWKPDIVCFQEVDHFSHVENLLRPYGYKGLYTQRTGGRPDGLAMFWNKTKFIPEAVQIVEFASLGLKDNVCQLTILKSKESSSAILIANIHVLFNPKRGDIKLAQVRTMFEAANALILSRAAGPCPIIVCGDFNSAVGSPLYEYILQGQLQLSNTDRRRLSGQVEVAGRTGWPNIRENFYNALQLCNDNEADAMEAAIVAMPRYNSMLDPHNSLREPTLLGNLDGGATNMMLPSAPATLERRERAASWSSSTVSSATSDAAQTKPKRPWSPEDIQVATGEEKSDGVARHPLQLESTYRAIAGSEPLYTTVHDKYVGTVDYIFYTTNDSQTIRPCRVLQPPPLRTMHNGLPSLTWPSDHLCLLADFELSM